MYKFMKLDEFGDMREKRVQNGLSQVDVAKHCGVSLPTYQRWEQGITKDVREENYHKLKEIFG